MQTFNNNNYKPKPLTIYNIFVFDANWSTYQTLCNPRSVEIKEVNKMLTCGQEFRIYHCSKCKLDHIVCFGCNSRICTHCGKRYTDKWSESVSKSVLDVNHRHFTISMPSTLWIVFERNRLLLKDYMETRLLIILQRFQIQPWRSIVIQIRLTILTIQLQIQAIMSHMRKGMGKPHLLLHQCQSQHI